jgi:hypothetical protein
MMNQQVMKMFIDHDYIFTITGLWVTYVYHIRTKLCRSNDSTYDKKVCSVNNTRSSNLELSSKQPSATCTKFLGQHALIIAHVIVNMNFNRRQHVSKN